MSANESSSVDQPLKNAPTQFVEPCLTPPGSDWSEPEKWVWQQVCEGEIADFNQRYGELDPKTSDGWSETREITLPFWKPSSHANLMKVFYIDMCAY